MAHVTITALWHFITAYGTCYVMAHITMVMAHDNMLMAHVTRNIVP